MISFTTSPLPFSGESHLSQPTPGSAPVTKARPCRASNLQTMAGWLSTLDGFCWKHDFLVTMEKAYFSGVKVTDLKFLKT